MTGCTQWKLSASSAVPRACCICEREGVYYLPPVLPFTFRCVRSINKHTQTDAGVFARPCVYGRWGNNVLLCVCVCVQCREKARPIDQHGLNSFSQRAHFHALLGALRASRAAVVLFPNSDVRAQDTRGRLTEAETLIVNRQSSPGYKEAQRG